MARPQLPNSRMQAEQSGFKLQNVLHALRRWWLPATVAGLLLAAGGVFAAHHISGKSYEATAMLQVSSQDQHLVYEKQPQYSDPFMPTQIELIRSPVILSQVLAQEEVAQLPVITAQKHPEKWLLSALSVDRLGQSELLEVKLTCSDPQSAAAIVNGVVTAYSNFHAEEKSRRGQRLIELLQAEQQERQQELSQLREEVKQMVQQDPSLLELQRSNLITNAPETSLSENLAATQADLHVQRAKVRALEETMSDTAASVDQQSVEVELEQYPAVARLNEVIAEKNAVIARTKAVAAGGASSQAVRELQSEVAALEQEKAKLKESMRAEIEQQLTTQQRAAFDQQLLEAKVELNGLQALERQLKEQYENREVDQAGGALAMEFLFKQTELDRAEMVYKQISDRADEMQTEVHAPARVTPLMAAEAPAPLESKRMIKMALAGGLGLLLPFALAVLFEQTRKPVRNAEQMTRDAHVNVIGELTYCPDKKVLHESRKRRAGDRQRLLYDESIDALRTRLMLGESLDQCQVIVVASATSGEGKTRLASQLAASMARSSGERTLLIDADARSPSIHKMFNLADEHGLVDVLEGTTSAHETIVSNWSPTLHILPAGRLFHNPHSVFHSERLEALWRELRDEYHHIVVDTPPILSAAESLTIAKHADGVLVCAMSEVSNSPRVERAYAQLAKVGANVIGLVINGVSSSEYESRYGAYHYAERYPDMGKPMPTEKPRPNEPLALR